jgi:CelD/BcsL family acetyltransferase involved in cellulose biosynthesis
MTAILEAPETSANPRDDYRITVLASPDQVSADWPRGGPDTAALCHPFQTRTYLDTWHATYGAAHGAQLCLVEVRDAARQPILMLPLMITLQHGCRVLGFTDLGVSDYNAPVLFPTVIVWDKPSVQRLWQAILARLPAFDMLILDKMPERVGTLANPLFLLADEANPESCHLTNLDRPWNEVEQHVQGAKNLRNRFRALQRLGSCELMIAQTREQREFILGHLLAQKQRRFEETLVPGFEAHPEKRDFFTLATESFAAVGALHLSALVVNGQVIAAYWAMTQGRRYYGLFITFEAGEWTKYSPGRVLHHQLLQHLSQQGYACLDLGIGDEPWKLAVCDVTIPLGRLRAAQTLRGRLALARLRLHEHLTATSLWQKLRPLKWIILRRLSPGQADAGR